MMLPATSTVHQLTLVIHLFTFAFAIVMVLREDWCILRKGKIEFAKLQKIARQLSALLLILWITGLILVGFKPGFDLALIIDNQKVAAKITVVSILTINGLLFHWMVLPKCRGAEEIARNTLLALIFFGAVSSVSWVCASILGAARIIAPLMTYIDFIALYVMMIILIMLLGLGLSGRLTKLMGVNHN